MVFSKSGKDQLQDALQEFTNGLSLEDRQNLPANPGLKDIVNFISDANRLSAKGKSRRYGERIQPFLEALRQFTGTVDVMVQSNPEIASLVWGTVKFFMTIAIAHHAYFESVCNNLERIGKLCPLIERFNALLPDPDLQDAVCEFYSIIVKLFTKLLPVLRKKGLKSYFKATIGSLKGEFRDFEAQLERHQGYVDGYIKLASERSHHHQRQLNAHFRSQVIDYTTQDVVRWNESLTLWLFLCTELRRDLLLEKITGYNFHDLYFRHLSKAHSGTGNWIFSFRDFEIWESKSFSKPILWCHGIPGSGKSVLTATISKQLLERYPDSTAFFFCDFQNKLSLKWETIVRSLVRQILSVADQDDTVLEKFDKPISQDEVVNILKQALEQKSQFYLIFDGIDECEESDKYKLLQLLESLFSPSKQRTKILVASRYSVDISRRMNEDRVQEINLVEHIRPDIEKYIEFELQERIRFRSLMVTPQMSKEIAAALSTKAEGMFLYVQFQIDDICTAITEDALRECLRGLPRGLPETYDRILAKIERSHDFPMAKKVFNWIVAASRPLTLEELAETCAFEPGDEQYADGRFPTDDWKIIFNCNNLVTVEPHRGKNSVHFAHSTVLGHLREKDIIVDTRANDYAACICMTYLNFSDFERQVARYKPNAHEIQIQNPKEWIPTLLAPSQNVASTTKAIQIVSGITNSRRSTASTADPPPINLRSLQKKFIKSSDSDSELDNELTPKELRYKYKFLEYVRQNWINHCRFMDDSHKCWNLFSKLILEKKLPVQHLPWADDIPSQDRAKSMPELEKNESLEISLADCLPVEWAIRCRNLPVVKVWRKNINDLNKWELILRSQICNGEVSIYRGPSDWRDYSIGGRTWKMERGSYKRMSHYDYIRIENPPLLGRAIYQRSDVTDFLTTTCQIHFAVEMGILYQDAAVIASALENFDGSWRCDHGPEISLERSLEICYPYAGILTDILGLLIMTASGLTGMTLAARSPSYVRERIWKWYRPRQMLEIAKMVEVLLKSGFCLPEGVAWDKSTSVLPTKHADWARAIYLRVGDSSPTYLELALHLYLPDIADLLVQFGATVPIKRDILKRAKEISASGVISAFYKIVENDPTLNIKDYEMLTPDIEDLELL
ncbi:hypothetical protein TWF730_008821 [Orbilia blumenaviensis]|uniref:NACHT domain-containing protein n=1 Tax=Orbilia blumenaviensis TaxID=1796055 RepID=A0AAV9V5V1_9PEZI